MADVQAYWVGGVQGQARAQFGASGAGDGVVGVDLGDGAGDGFSGGAPLGHEVGVLQSAVGVEGSLGQFHAGEPAGGGDGIVLDGLGASVGREVGGVRGEAVAVGGPAALRVVGLGQVAQQTEGVPGVVPGWLEVVVQEGVQSVGEPDHRGGVAFFGGVVVGRQQGVEFEAVEGGVGGRAGGPVQLAVGARDLGVFGIEGGAQACGAGGRVDPGQEGGKMLVLQPALARDPAGG
jgi:hypothetical protein